jgi:hypothetical protein
VGADTSEAPEPDPLGMSEPETTGVPESETTGVLDPETTEVTMETMASDDEDSNKDEGAK